LAEAHLDVARARVNVNVRDFRAAQCCVCHALSVDWGRKPEVLRIIFGRKSNAGIVDNPPACHNDKPHGVVFAERERPRVS
jgi:hypothetical protein